MNRASRRRRVATGVAASIGATAAMASAAQAADIEVTTIGDTGTGSLREAIDEANATPLTSDRILFESGLSGSIELESDLPELSGPIEFDGPGDQLKIDGQGDHRIFQSGDDVSVTGLTLASGSAAYGGAIGVFGAALVLEETRIEGSTATQGGGAIRVVSGHLTLRDSEIAGNQAPQGGGLSAQETAVAISGTTISGNQATGVGPAARGGGAMLYLDPSAPSTITDSVFSQNSSYSGAGLVGSGGDLTIESSLFADNDAASAVGAFALGNPGQPGTFTVSNSTITGNEAVVGAAGIVTFGDQVTVESSTFTKNTVTSPGPVPFYRAGGITQGGGTMSLRNSIVSGNVPEDISTLPANPSPPFPAGEINGSFDLIGIKTNADFTETVAGSNIDSTDPRLGALADNGGPTRTMLPADTSPVVNKGSSALTVDQRGLIRPVDFNSIPFSAAAGANGADIGAVELQGGPLPPPPPPGPPSNAFGFGKVKLNKKKGLASLQVKVPGAGKVQVLGGKTVAKASKTAKKKSTLSVTIKAKGKAAKQLKKKGRAKVTAKVRFTPTGGTARTKSKAVKLVKKKPKKKM